MNRLVKTITSSLGKKYLMALSGAFLGLFILIHLIGNSTALWGRATFLGYVEHLHGLGALIPIFEAVLLIVFLTHVGFGLTLYWENLQSRPSRYQVSQSSGGRTLGSRTMPYTGIIILCFLGMHLKQFHFAQGDLSAADLIKYTLGEPLYAALYIVGVLALALHTSHGFWSLFQSLGIEHPKYTPFIKKCALAGSVAIGLLFGLIPILSLTCPAFLR